MFYPLPAIGAKGIYVLEAPFQDEIGANVSCECTSIRSFGDVIASGHDPFTLYYKPYQLEKVTYNEHAKNGACIVTLQTSSGKILHVPSALIRSFPIAGGVPYTSLVLAVKIGAVPDSLPLDNVFSLLQETVRNTLGYPAEVRAIKVSDTVYKSQEDHEALETARQHAISTSFTSYGMMLKERQRANALQDEVAALKQYILDHIPEATSP